LKKKTEKKAIENKKKTLQRRKPVQRAVLVVKKVQKAPKNKNIVKKVLLPKLVEQQSFDIPQEITQKTPSKRFVDFFFLKKLLLKRKKPAQRLQHLAKKPLFLRFFVKKRSLPTKNLTVQQKIRIFRTELRYGVQFFLRKIAGYGFVAINIAVIAAIIFISATPSRTVYAGSTSYDFGTSGDYSLSDSTKIEVTSNTARLSNQQYTTDANTKGYWRFDETSGNTADDQTVNNNDGTFGTTSPCAGATWSGGKVAADGVTISTNGATTLSGVPNCLSAADSSSLSISGVNPSLTMEAMVKFSSAFDKTTSVSQGIFDKGNYKLYFDETDGKIKFELYDSTTKTWSKVGGANTSNINLTEGTNSSWRQYGPGYITAMAEYNSKLYVGTSTSGTASLGTAEIWRYDGSSVWTKVVGDGLVNDQWDNTTFEQVLSLVVFNGFLFAGLGNSAGDGELWYYDDSPETLARAKSFTNAEEVYSLATDGTYIYAGTGSTAGDADVWRCQTNCQLSNATWTQIGGDTLNTSWASSTYERVRTMIIHASTLFVGLGDTAAEAEVWRWNGSNAWTKMGGDGVGSTASWATADNIEYVFSMASDGTNLYVGTGLTAGDADVWACTANCTSGTPSWTKIGGDGVNSSWAASTFETVRSLTYVGGKLYAGIGDSAGEGEVWRYDNPSWVKVGGDGANTSWDATFTNPNSTTNNKELAYTYALADGSLIAATGYTTHQDMEVWSCASCGTSPTWSWVGGRDWRSWGAFQLSEVTSMAVEGGYLYVGFGSTNKSAVVWRYDGTTWSQIGGGNLNLDTGERTWEEYEYIRSMTSYKGNIYVGTGDTAQDADVWKLQDNGLWKQVGGDGKNSGWSAANNIEQVTVLAADDTYLYAGTGNSTTDSDLWRYDGSTWGTNPIGGSRNDTNAVMNSSWAINTYERITSIAIYNGLVFVGLGSSAGDAEVWRWNGSTWGGARIGGDGGNSSWANTTYEAVRSLVFVGSTLYAGLGETGDESATADAEVWACSNCTNTGATADWGTTPIGGNTGSANNWNDTDYEGVNSLIVYNGELYAMLGLNVTAFSEAGDAELWRYNPSVGVDDWSKVGGDGIGTPASWSTNYEGGNALAVFNGRMYVGLGDTSQTGAASDAEVWEYGGNVAHITSSSTSSWTSGTWRHIAAVYDGAAQTAKIYVDGVQDGSTGSFAATLGDGSLALSVGTTKDQATSRNGIGSIKAQLDEARISSSARTSFVLTRYSPSVQTVRPTTALPRLQKYGWGTFSTNETANGGTITYRLSNDNAATWKYWNGSTWATSASTAEANSAAVVNTNLPSLTMTSSGLLWQGILSGNGDQQVAIGSVTVGYVDDTTAPNNVSNVTGNDGAWFDRTNPVFTWSAPTDDVPTPNPNSEQASGVEGYYVYFGTNANAIPRTAGTFQTATSYTASAIPTNDTSPYYFRIQTRDNAQNTTSDVSGIYDKFRDSTAPNNVTSVTGNANSGNWFDRANPVFTWSAPTDDLPSPNTNNEIASGIKGYYVYFGTNASAVPRTAGTFTTSTTYTASPILAGDEQTYYFRIQTVDKALNVTSDSTGIYDAFRDTTAPNVVSAVTGNANSGEWFDRANPVFTWSAPTDDLPSPNPTGEKASGVKGYYVYFGTNPNAVPRTAGTFITSTTYTATPISGSDTQRYYFRIQTRDNAFNTSSDVSGIFDSFDDQTAPSVVDTIIGNDTGGEWFDRSNPQFSWSPASDSAPIPNPDGEHVSGVDGYYVYFGTNANAIPRVSGTFQTGTSYTASPISGSDTQSYYLRIQTRDRAMNITDDTTGVFDPFRDTKAPNNVTSVTALSSNGGSAILEDTWYNHTAPYFSWSAPTDDLPSPNTNNEKASGVKGYYVYFGTNASAVPRTAGTFQTGTTYTASSLTSGETYYLRIQTRDKALNTTSDVSGIYDAFTYKIDTVGPSGPTVSASPAGYTAVNNYTFFWLATGPTAPVDPGAPTHGSGFSGNYIYRVGSGAWSSPTTDTQVIIPDAAYQEGVNTFEIRAIDNIGNEGPSSTASFYYSGSAPAKPENLQVSPSSSAGSPSATNSFSFTWDPPVSSSSPVSLYHYSINKLPTLNNTTSTTFTSLNAGPYATQQGKNTLYVVAEDEAGNVNYENPASVDFYALTPAPSAPTATQIFDISNRDTSEFAISMKWSEPSKANGFDGYEVYRSEDNVTFESAGTTKSPVFIDTNLESKTYYYKVRSKDNAGQYSVDSSTVELVPTGRYTTPPKVTDGPTIAAKSFSAAVEWQTDRIASSFVEYGADQYHLGKQNGGETVGTLDLSLHHEVTVNGLQPETIYYYQAVWVDQDGNRGQSDILSFTTGLRPKISDVKITNITLASADISWTSTTVATSTINYGTTHSYGSTITDVSGSQTTRHTLRIDALADATTYFFVITGTDLDGNALASDEYNFTTLTRPSITGVSYEQVKDAPTTTFKFSWKTNVPTTTILAYGRPGAAQKTQSDPAYNTDHTATATSLSDLTLYTMQARGVDRFGNVAAGNVLNITTPDDSRAPRVLNMTVEVRSSGVGQGQKAQLVVNWETDEPSTSQVEYGPGISSESYPSRTQEDPALSTTHVVIVPELEPAKLYHLRAVSRDRAGNAGTSDDTTSITGKANRSVIDIIVSSLQRSLGFLSIIPGLSQ
jgi:hypothetical protein